MSMSTSTIDKTSNRRNFVPRNYDVQEKIMRTVNELKALLEYVAQQNGKVKELKTEINKYNELNAQKIEAVKKLDQQLKYERESGKQMTIMLDCKKKEISYMEQQKEERIRNENVLRARYQQLTAVKQNTTNRHYLAQAKISLMNKIKAEQIECALLRREIEILQDQKRTLRKIGRKRLNVMLVLLAESYVTYEKSSKEINKLVNEIRKIEAESESLELEWEEMQRISLGAAVESTVNLDLWLNGNSDILGPHDGHAGRPESVTESLINESFLKNPNDFRSSDSKVAKVSYETSFIEFRKQPNEKGSELWSEPATEITDEVNSLVNEEIEATFRGFKPHSDAQEAQKVSCLVSSMAKSSVNYVNGLVEDVDVCETDSNYVDRHVQKVSLENLSGVATGSATDDAEIKVNVCETKTYDSKQDVEKISLRDTCNADKDSVDNANDFAADVKTNTYETKIQHDVSKAVHEGSYLDFRCAAPDAAVGVNDFVEKEAKTNICEIKVQHDVNKDIRRVSPLNFGSAAKGFVATSRIPVRSPVTSPVQPIVNTQLLHYEGKISVSCSPHKYSKISPHSIARKKGDDPIYSPFYATKICDLKEIGRSLPKNKLQKHCGPKVLKCKETIEGIPFSASINGMTRPKKYHGLCSPSYSNAPKKGTVEKLTSPSLNVQTGKKPRRINVFNTSGIIPTGRSPLLKGRNNATFPSEVEKKSRSIQKLLEDRNDICSDTSISVDGCIPAIKRHASCLRVKQADSGGGADVTRSQKKKDSPKIRQPDNSEDDTKLNAGGSKSVSRDMKQNTKKNEVNLKTPAVSKVRASPSRIPRADYSSPVFCKISPKATECGTVQTRYEITDDASPEKLTDNDTMLAKNKTGLLKNPRLANPIAGLRNYSKNQEIRYSDEKKAIDLQLSPDSEQEHGSVVTPLLENGKALNIEGLSPKKCQESSQQMKSIEPTTNVRVQIFAESSDFSLNDLANKDGVCQVDGALNMDPDNSNYFSDEKIDEVDENGNHKMQDGLVDEKTVDRRLESDYKKRYANASVLFEQNFSMGEDALTLEDLKLPSKRRNTSDWDGLDEVCYKNQTTIAQAKTNVALGEGFADTSKYNHKNTDTFNLPKAGKRDAFAVGKMKGQIKKRCGSGDS